eukprot:scaffold6574_cov261-Chaetoceros_neogracile.AAC.31
MPTEEWYMERHFHFSSEKQRKDISSGPSVLVMLHLHLLVNISSSSSRQERSDIYGMTNHIIAALNNSFIKEDGSIITEIIF